MKIFIDFYFFSLITLILYITTKEFCERKNACGYLKKKIQIDERFGRPLFQVKIIASYANGSGLYFFLNQRGFPALSLKRFLKDKNFVIILIKFSIRWALRKAFDSGKNHSRSRERLRFFILFRNNKNSLHCNSCVFRKKTFFRKIWGTLQVYKPLGGPPFYEKTGSTRRPNLRSRKCQRRLERSEWG